MTKPGTDRLSFEEPIERMEKRLKEMERSNPTNTAGQAEVTLLAQARSLRRELIDLKQMIYANLET